MKINKTTLFLGLILLLGFFIRLWNLGNNPVSIYWDEAAIGYDAYALAQTGKDMHGNSGLQAIFPSYGDYKLPLYIWLTAIWVKILGPTVEAIRLTSALSGTALIAVVYAVSKKLKLSDMAALAAASVIALSPWAIQFSRAGFEASLAVLGVTLMVLCLLKSRENPSFLYWASLTAGLSTYAYFSVRFVLPLILMGFVILMVRNPMRKYWLHLGLSIMGYLILTLPIYLSSFYQVSNQFRLSTESLLNTDNQVISQNVNRELAGNGLFARIVYHRNWFLLKRLGQNIGTHLDWRYLFFNGDSNLRHGTGRVGLFLLPTAVFLLTGLLWGGKHRLRTTVFLIIWWLAALIPASVPLTVPHALRSLNALPAIAILIGMGIGNFLESSNKLIKLLGILLVIMSFIEWQSYWHDYRRHYPARSSTSWQYGYEQAARTLAGADFENRTIYVEPLDRLYLYFLFFNRIDPTQIQGKTHDFQIQAFDRYRFQSIDEQELKKLKAGEVTMTARPLSPDDENLHLLKVINNWQGLPLYYIYEKQS